MSQANGKKADENEAINKVAIVILLLPSEIARVWSYSHYLPGVLNNMKIGC